MTFLYLNILNGLKYKTGVLVVSPYLNSEGLIPDLVVSAHKAGGRIEVFKILLFYSYQQGPGKLTRSSA